LFLHSAHASLSYPFFFLTIRPPPRSPLFPYTTLFRSGGEHRRAGRLQVDRRVRRRVRLVHPGRTRVAGERRDLRILREVAARLRSEEHTSELQSLTNLVCRLLLEKKKRTTQ